MKLIVFANAILLGLLLTPFAHAQSMSGFKANVPFEFRIGSTTHTAGEYSVVGTSVGSNVLLMQNLDRKPGTPMLLSPVQAKSKADLKEAKLVFHRYGNTYFLSEVWQGYGHSSGLQLQQSKAERTIAHRMATLRTPDAVEIALNSFHTRDAGY